MENMLQIIDEELKASNKGQKPVNIYLSKKDAEESVYTTTLPFALDGDFVLTAPNLEGEIAVQVETDEETMTVSVTGVHCEALQINASLSKDESTILRAIAQMMSTSPEFRAQPSFIVGPPGTGKTKVITKILAEAMLLNEKILVLSPTNMAVENVFERIDTKAMNLKEGEVILTIKTEEAKLKRFSYKEVAKKKLAPIEDEIELLNYAKEEIYGKKRELESKIYSLVSSEESDIIVLSNLEKEHRERTSTLSGINDELASVNHRIDSLTSNAFIKTVAGAFMSTKLEELEDQRKLLEKKNSTLEASIKSLDTRIVDAKNVKNKSARVVLDIRKSLNELNNGFKEIAARLDELNKEMAELKAENVFNDARIVGATLVSAALNQRIQNGEFDKIIVDEASMALVPTLLVAANALKKEKEYEPKKIQYKEDTELYAAQNKAVEMSLNHRIVFVGDPKQLSPIAKTYEMKKSIFEWHNIDQLFNGVKMDNAVFLDINFRNHPDITKLASDMFYGGLLKSGKKHDGSRSIFIRYSKSLMIPKDKSFANQGNAAVVLQQVEHALAKGRRSIGVITPYRAQADLLNESFEAYRAKYPDADIQAGTVHKFQGKEKDIVIFDITYSPAEGAKLNIPATYQGGADSETAKLLNVAMTRAESFFVLVGNVAHISHLQNKNLILQQWAEKIRELQENS